MVQTKRHTIIHTPQKIKKTNESGSKKEEKNRKEKTKTNIKNN